MQLSRVRRAYGFNVPNAGRGRSSCSIRDGTRCSSWWKASRAEHVTPVTHARTRRSSTRRFS